jgi:tRNA-Thr(GGU) m(6)t(6)A37 methyltransferase TsaA
MDETNSIACRPLGIVHSPYKETVGVPIQTAGVPHEPGMVEVYAEFAPGLKDIEGFEYLILITQLHLVTQQRLEVVPFLDHQAHGVFATRAPNRPNRLGLSIVRLTSVDGRFLHFCGNDMVDRTPVLDIKPYVPDFDVRQTERVGWFAPRLAQAATTRSDDRMR